MDRLISEYVKEMKLVNGLNRQRIFAAWDKASGAGRQTTGRYIRDGVLYCSISSSMLRTRLFYNRAAILDRMNAILSEDSMFAGTDGRQPLKDIVLK